MITKISFSLRPTTSELRQLKKAMVEFRCNMELIHKILQHHFPYQVKLYQDVPTQPIKWVTENFGPPVFFEKRFASLRDAANFVLRFNRDKGKWAYFRSCIYLKKGTDAVLTKLTKRKWGS